MNQNALLLLVVLVGLGAVGYLIYQWRLRVQAYDRAASEQAAKYEQKMRDHEQRNQERAAKYEAHAQEREAKYDAQFEDGRNRDQEIIMLLRTLVDLVREHNAIVGRKNQS